MGDLGTIVILDITYKTDTDSYEIKGFTEGYVKDSILKVLNDDKITTKVFSLDNLFDNDRYATHITFNNVIQKLDGFKNEF